MWLMEAGKFFRFARRLPAYHGAMRAAAERAVRDDERRKERAGVAADTEIVAVASGELSKIPGLAGLAAEGMIDFG